MRQAACFGVLLLGLTLPASSLWGTGQSNRDEFNAVPAWSALRTVRHYPATSPQWHWVYEGVAHGQSFRAEGSTVNALRLRVARLNRRMPEAPLKVEIRDEELRNVYLTGSIQPREAGRRFQWTQVEVDYSIPLEREQSYILLVHSSETRHNAPWLVNATSANPYPEGKHLGYPDDLFFSFDFDLDTVLHVGPPLRSLSDLPHNSGRPGGFPMPTPPTLRFPGTTRPPFAVSDKLGPIPDGKKRETTAQMMN